jgi:hypothetical protein
MKLNISQQYLLSFLLWQMVRNTMPLERQQVTKRCRALATFMESLMDDISKPNLKVECPEEEHRFSVS